MNFTRKTRRRCELIGPAMHCNILESNVTTLQQSHYALRKMKDMLFMRCNELVRLSSWQHRSDLGALIRSRNLSARSLPLCRQLSAVMEGLQNSVTTKGKAAVIYEGYRYRVKKNVDTTTYWQCLEPGCLGRLKTNALGVTPGGLHTHPPFCGKSMRLGKHAQYSTPLFVKNWRMTAWYFGCGK